MASPGNRAGAAAEGSEPPPPASESNPSKELIHLLADLRVGGVISGPVIQTGQYWATSRSLKGLKRVPLEQPNRMRHAAKRR